MNEHQYLEKQSLQGIYMPDSVGSGNLLPPDQESAWYSDDESMALKLDRAVVFGVYHDYLASLLRGTTCGSKQDRLTNQG